MQTEGVVVGAVVIPDYVVTIDEYWLNLLVSTLLPVVVALVTKRFAEGSTRALILLFLSVLTGFFTTLQATGGTFELKATVVGILVSFVTAVATHTGLLNGLVTGDGGVILKSLVPGGIGSVDVVKKEEYYRKAAA
jgi:hypothetical protein